MFLVALAVASASVQAQQRAPAASPSGESRIALIIGNSSYKVSPLANPVNDARAMARVLNDAGFTVKVATNLTRSQMRDEIRKFGDALRDQPGVGLFFFAGHGVQVNGRNYLIPVGSDIRRENEVEDEAVDANFVLSTMETAKARMNIVILDACRDNPFAGSFRSSMRGLAPMNTPSSTVVAYATAPGQTASDGTGDNGLYTRHLVEQIAVPGQSILEMFINVRNAVQRESAGRQTPWELSSLTVSFQFKPGVAAPAGASQADVDRAVQAALKKREDEETARRSSQQGEIERAVLAALKKREEEQAAAQSARAEKENQDAKLAIERLNKELAELRAAREAAPAAAPQRPAPAPSTAVSQTPSSAPVQLALAAPSSPRATPAFSVGGRIERPDVRVGDRWKYQVTEGFTGSKHAAIVEVASVTENRIYTQTVQTTLAAMGLPAAAGVVDVWDRDWNQLRSGEQEFTPFYPWLQFPLEPGKTWTGRPKRTGGGTPAFDQQLTAKVEGWERVTVPAGTFDTVKITIQGHYSSHTAATAFIQSGSIHHVIWYSPEARQAVKKEIVARTASRSGSAQSELWELLEYKTDGAEPPSSPVAATQVATAPQSASSAPVQLGLAAPNSPRATPTAAASGRIERPDVRAGDRWKYEVTDGFSSRKHAAIVEVASVTESQIYTQTAQTTLVATGIAPAAGVVEVWDRDWNQLRHGEQEYAPYFPWLQFPLESGKAWSSRARHTAAGTVATNYQLTAKVEGWEKVTVPAGTFDALKITWTGNFAHEQTTGPAGISNGNVKNVIWYAPAVRQAVKKELRMQDFNPRINQSKSERWELLEYKAD